MGKCKDCIYFVEKSFCFRYPPVYSGMADKEPIYMLIEVNEDYWCGEYVAQKTQE